MTGSPLADAKNLAQTLDGEFLLRRIDETEPHRLPSLAKKVAALFRISRSCRKISFSRRNRFSSAARSSCRSGGGASISCSRRLSSQRRSVERPTPRSRAISLCVRPLTSTNRTASAANSFPNRRCGLPMKCSSFLQKSSPLSQGKSTHLRRHLYVTCYTEGSSHFVTSMTAPVASGWSGCRVGLAPTGKRRLVTAHTQSGHFQSRLWAPRWGKRAIRGEGRHVIDDERRF